MIKVRFDTVVAIDPCKMRESGTETLVVGENYKLLKYSKTSIALRDKQGEQHTFCNQGDETKLFESQFVKPVKVEVLEASGKVRLNEEGLEYFIGWFGGPNRKEDEDKAREKHSKNKGFKIVEKDVYSIRIKHKKQMWWVNAQMLDFRDLVVEG